MCGCVWVGTCYVVWFPEKRFRELFDDGLSSWEGVRKLPESGFQGGPEPRSPGLMNVEARRMTLPGVDFA